MKFLSNSAGLLSKSSEALRNAASKQSSKSSSQNAQRLLGDPRKSVNLSTRSDENRILRPKLEAAVNR
jgi:hypothetical protein